MSKLIVAAVLLPALCLATNYVPPAQWPLVFMPYNESDPYPTAYERAATFWYSLFRVSFARTTTGTYLNLNADLFSSTTLPIGTVDLLGPRRMGLNTLRGARYHAFDRFHHCLSAAGSSMDASNMTSQTTDCSGTTDTTRWANWLLATTDLTKVKEPSYARPFTPLGWHPLYAPRLAISDIVCQGAWSSVANKWGLRDSGLELSCGGTFGVDSITGNVNSYAISCLQTELAEASSTVAPSWGGEFAATAGHTVNKAGNLAYFISLYDDVADVIQVIIENETAPIDVPALYGGGNNYMYVTALPISSFAGKSCVGYRFNTTNTLTGASYMYPPSGWFMTTDLGTCQENICECVHGDGTCCSDGCHFDAAGTSCGTPGSQCFLGPTCSGTSAVCQPAGFAPNGTLCGLSNQTNTTCDSYDTCDGFGSCVSNIAVVGTLCGDTTTTSCHAPDTCNGAGECLSGDVSDGTVCGVNNTCRSDICEAGICVTTHAANGTICANVADGSCTLDSECWSGTCTPEYEPSSHVCQTASPGNPCDADDHCSGTSSTTCHASDSCNGAGTCISGNAPEGTVCGVNNTCRSDLCSAGTCVTTEAANGTVCANTADGICTLNSECTSGVCNSVFQPASHVCQTASPGNPCDADDHCSGTSGTCVTTYAAENTTCGSSSSCVEAPLCNAVGVCLGSSNKPSGTPCGLANQTNTTCDGWNTTCHASDSCNGAGTCISGNAPEGTVCGVNNTCRSDLCSAGTCVTTEAANGTVCANTADGICTLNSECTSGVCNAVYQPASHVCQTASPGNPCDADDHCSGSSATCVTTYAAVNTSCGSASLCVNAPLCNAVGVCQSATNMADGTYCGSANPLLSCDADDLCLSGVCHNYVQPNGHVCRNSSDPDGCDPVEVCNGINTTCPADVPCTDCRRYTSWWVCDARPECQWCGQWGCQNYSAGSPYCREPACGSFTTDNIETTWDNDSHVCPYTGLPSGSLEVVTPVLRAEASILRSICFVVHVDTAYNSSTLDTTTFDLTVVVYNSSGAGNRPGTLLYTRSVNVPVIYVGLNLVEINLTTTTADYIVIPGGERHWVGISYCDHCPHIDLAVLESALNASFVRDPSEALPVPGLTPPEWNHTDETFDISVDTFYGVCGDGVVAGTEQCDTIDPQKFCGEDCMCPEDSILDPDGSCACNHTLPQLDGHHFIAPPFMEAELVTLPVDTVDLSVWLPQTRPVRTDAWGRIVNPRDGSNLTHFDRWPLHRTPCWLYGETNATVEELITYGAPIVIAFDSYYVLRFAMEVTWMENVTMYRNPNVDRHMSAKLSFDLLINRQLTVSSNITILDSTVLWAYIRHGFLVIPDTGLPYFDINLETMAKIDGIYIENDSFYYIAHTGSKISWISKPEQFEFNIEGHSIMQSWRFNVFLNNTAVCSLGNSDNFTLGYSLIAIEGDVSPASQRMVFSLATGENWCSVSNTTVALTAQMATYARPDYVPAHITRRFLRGSHVYALVSVPQQYGITTTAVYLVDAEVSGDALLISPGPVPATWELTNLTCPGLLSNEVCYSIYLPHDDLREDAQLTLLSRVYVDIAVKRRATINSARTAVAGSRIFLTSRKPSVTPDGAAAPPTQKVIVYGVTPMFLVAVGTLAAVSVLSVVATVWFISNRRVSAL
eukprot:m51a1_g351 putative C-tail anchored protein (1651) ;mRNA; f:555202-561023